MRRLQWYKRGAAYHFMPCVGDKVVINNLTYKIKSRVFKCQGKTVKVVLKKVDNENTNS